MSGEKPFKPPALKYLRRKLVLKMTKKDLCKAASEVSDLDDEALVVCRWTSKTRHPLSTEAALSVNAPIFSVVRAQRDPMHIIDRGSISLTTIDLDSTNHWSPANTTNSGEAHHLIHGKLHCNSQYFRFLHILSNS